MADAIAVPAEPDGARRIERPIHPRAIRVMHWVNALAMILLIGSGWLIYDDEIIFGWLQFPRSIVIGIEAQHALQWHFFAMWVLGLNGLSYLAYGVVSGRLRRKLFPIRFKDLKSTVGDALTLRLGHEDLSKYNAVQKLLYLGVILVISAQVTTGLAIWKPVQLQGLFVVLYDFQTARLLHFLGMAAICGFLIIHVALALLVPRTILAMITGGHDRRTPSSVGGDR